jgi:hypothetical protein
MTGKGQLGRQVIGAAAAIAASSVVKALVDRGKTLAVDKAANTAVTGATKPLTAMVDRRRNNRLRNETIYRLLDKVRVIGETALALGDDAQNDERQRIVKDSAAVRDALHERLADLRLSSGTQKSEVLDAIQAAIADADRLVTALNKWAPNSSNAKQTTALRGAVQALNASEDALLAALDKTGRRRSSKGENGSASDGRPRSRP